VIHPQPNDIWRIDWQLAPGTDIEAECRTGAFDKRVRAVIGDIPYEVDWLSTYRFHQRVVARFVVGRVLFAGDAAHSLPPYGSRGMNSGIQDADNLAWKLALVVSGEAGEALLQTYHAERYAAAVENLAVTEATIRFMVPPTRLKRLVRTTLLRLAGPLKPVRGLVNSGRMAEPFAYRNSPIVEAGGNPLIGRFAPDGWVTCGERRIRIRTLFGNEFVVLCFGVDSLAAERLVGELPSGGVGAPFRMLVVGDGDAEPPKHDEVTMLGDDDRTLLGAYGLTRPGVLIIRPDGHIGAAVDGLRGDAVLAALARCAGAPVDVRLPSRVAA
jgi:3-(3-hydroxy-phenyl)propionate hydroxylase